MSGHRIPSLWNRVRRYFSDPELRRAWGHPATLPFPASPDVGLDEASSADDLWRLLSAELARVTGLRASHWIMSEAWFKDLCEAQDPSGHLLWTLHAETAQRGRPSGHLLGIPVQVHPWANVPTLVPHKLG